MLYGRKVIGQEESRMSLEALVVVFGACWFLLGLAVGFLCFKCVNWSAVRAWLEEQVAAK